MKNGSIEQLKVELAAQAAKPSAPDPLEKIKGIGAVFASRLNNADIFTFSQLAALPLPELRKSSALKSGRKLNWKNGSSRLCTSPGKLSNSKRI
jgi:nucleotidyltransferase/DNA polymerase involved in DNA repair